MHEHAGLTSSAGSSSPDPFTGQAQVKHKYQVGGRCSPVAATRAQWQQQQSARKLVPARPQASGYQSQLCHYHPPLPPPPTHTLAYMFTVHIC